MLRELNGFRSWMLGLALAASSSLVVVAGCGSNATRGKPPGDAANAPGGDVLPRPAEPPLDEAPMPMHAEDSFRLTVPLTPWQLNRVSWDDAKNHRLGYAMYEDLIIGAEPDERPTLALKDVRQLRFDWLLISASACERDGDQPVQLTLTSVDDGVVSGSIELVQGKAVAVDPRRQRYQLRIELQNLRNCAGFELQLGVAALKPFTRM